MWPRPIEVRDVLAQHAGEVPLAEDEQVIQAFATHAAQEALARRVGPQGAVGRAQDRDAAGRGGGRERCPERAVVIADQVLRALVEGRVLSRKDQQARCAILGA